MVSGFPQWNEGVLARHPRDRPLKVRVDERAHDALGDPAAPARLIHDQHASGRFGLAEDVGNRQWGKPAYVHDAHIDPIAGKSLRVAQRLAEDGIDVRVVDLRWLVPLPVADIVREAEATGNVLIVDETRRSGGVSEGIVSALVDAHFEGTISRVTSKDSFVPLGAAADHVLLQEGEIEAAARALVGGQATGTRTSSPTSA